MPNVSPSGNSSSGDGIYYHEEEQDEREHVESPSLLSIRKRLIDQYIKSRIEDQHDECGCHFGLDSQNNDLKLLDKLDKFNAIDKDELRLISSPTSTKPPPPQPRRRRRQRHSSKRTKLSEPHVRARQQQQVTSVRREGSAFTRLITPATDKLERILPLCSIASVSKDDASIGSATALAYNFPVAHRHRQRKSVVVSNGQKQQHCGIIDKPARLFIDDSESVQSSSVAPGGCCCCWQCFAENNNNNNYENNNSSSSSCERHLVHREIYEPRSGQPPGAATASSGGYCHQDRRSWPYYSNQASTGQPLATHQAVRGSSSARFVRDTTFYKTRPLATGRFFVTRAFQIEESASASGEESGEDLDKFDTRSALDCVEEFSPTWSDLSSVQIENSDQVSDFREEKDEEELARGASASNLASWIQLQKMEVDGIYNSQERNNNNNNVAAERKFGCDLNKSNYELEARPECARPSGLGRENRQELDEKREAADEESRRTVTKQANRKTNKTKLKQQQHKTRKKKREQEKEENHKEKEEEEEDLSNCIVASEQQQQQQASTQSECESASMRVARDFAKLSVPSLSSLQFLPGQLDVKPAKIVDRRASQVKSSLARSSMSSGGGGGANPTRMSAAPRVANQEIDGPQSISAHAIETANENQKHDESCLLDRLCMCNCMAGKKPKSVDAAESTHIPISQPQTAAKTRARSSPAARATSSKGSQASSRAEACASPVSLSESVDLHEDGQEKGDDVVSSRVDSEINAPSAASANASSPLPRAGGNVVNVRDDDAAAGNRSSEKQSPTFLGLLRPAAYSRVGVTRQKTSRGHPLDTGTTRVQPSKRFAVASSKVLGSTDDLEASGRSSSSASVSQAASDFCSPSLSSKFSAYSKLFASKHSKGEPRLLHNKFDAGQIKSSDILSDQEKTRGGKIEIPSCANVTNQDPRRRKPAYKRLLSPSKLFHNSSTSSHSSICEDCKPAAAASDAAASFLSRSLSRLSGRSPGKRDRLSLRPPTSQQHEHDTTRPAAKRREQQLPAGLSPPLWNHSQLDTYCSDSINSLEEEINLCHSLPYDVNLHERPETPNKSSTRLLLTPEIVLSRVEYQDLEEADEEKDGPSECSFEERMTRSSSGLGQQRSNGRHSSCSERDHKLYKRLPPPQQQRRHASEISFHTTSDGSANSTRHGPFSLPASPRASRRHCHLSRGARLCSSPVPFHSPASESTKIEDGLKVCSTGYFEKHIGNIKVNQMEAQKRLFTAWINHYAPNLIVRDLFIELQDGIKLIGLLATLTRDRRLLAEYERLNRDKRSYVNRLALTPSSRLTHISNVHIAIDYMRTNLGMKLVNLHPMDIVSGKENVILGLCWNIILHFQLSRDLLGSSSAASSCSLSSSSRLSLGDPTNHRGARTPLGKGAQYPGDEMSSKDLASARAKLLSHINKRFKLKLTNLASSLLDGDVLLAIIKQTLPANTAGLHDDSRLAGWPQMDEVEKLDVCFQLAQDYLNVPWLISASDLRRETRGERNSKPLLVYLSMLLKANPCDCSTDQMLELRQLDESLRGETTTTTTTASVAKAQQVSCDRREVRESDPSHEELIQDYLDQLDTDDKFHIDKLQITLGQLARLDTLIESAKTSGICQLDECQKERIDKLKRQAEQVDSLINWINEADKLFEAKQEASCNLTRTSELHDQSVVFFSPTNLPQIDISLCPTLERQYRECLAAARQHILSLEQIMKNWTSHKEATRQLKDWLIKAELKLESALRPNGHLAGGCLQELRREFNSDEQIDQQKNRLDDLIEFFELEQIDELDMLSPINNQFASLDGRSSSLSNIDLTEHSLSGSLLSLGSTGSRMSTLASSRKATHHRLFYNLELQSHLLAAILETEQRDSILMAVKTFNLRMKQILEYKVPQVVSDICMSINRCKMQIKEQEEELLASEPELEDFASVELVVVESSLEDKERPVVCDRLETSGQISPKTSSASVLDEIAGTANVSPCPLPPPPPPQPSPPPPSLSPSPSPSQVAGRNNSPPVSASKMKRQKRKAARAQQSRNSNKQIGENSKTIKKINILGKIAPKVSATSKCSDDSNECEPFYRSLWHKIVRASRMSLSFNIVLLICLAGICVVPLIQKDACCELSQTPIPTERFTVNQRPT